LVNKKHHTRIEIPTPIIHAILKFSVEIVRVNQKNIVNHNTVYNLENSIRQYLFTS